MAAPSAVAGAAPSAAPGWATAGPASVKGARGWAMAEPASGRAAPGWATAEPVSGRATLLAEESETVVPSVEEESE